MKIVHFCAGLEFWNGMANTARQFMSEEIAQGHESEVTDQPFHIVSGVDVVYIHGAWLPVLWKAAKRAKAVGAKLIIRPAGSYDPVRLAYHGWKKRLAAFFEHRMLRRADVLLATCAAEAKWIHAYEPRAKNIELTNLKRFFDFNRVERVEDGGSFDAEAQKHRGTEIHLLYLGRRHPLKGVEYLEKAVAELNNNSVNLVQEDSTRSTCSTRLRIDLKIVSDAFGEELEHVWNWCDVLMLPTLSENFGRVVAEALERGKRVITTDGAPVWGEEESGGACECVREGVVGRLGGKLIYLKGYRDGSDEERVKLLTKAILTVSGDEMI